MFKKLVEVKGEKLKYLLIILFLSFLFGQSKAQETILEFPENLSFPKRDSAFCVPSVSGLPRSKGIVFKKEYVYDYFIESISNTGEKGRSEISSSKRFQIKLRAPVVMKPNFKLAFGFSYFKEEFEFENIGTSNFTFHQDIDDKGLRSIGGEVFAVKPFIGNKYILFRAKGELSGDYNKNNSPNSDFFRFQVAALFGIKRNDYTSAAFGLVYRYKFGVISVLPVLSYFHNFNRQWGFESLLPSKVAFRYSTIDERNYLFAKAELKGTNYNINLLNPSPFEKRLLILEKTEIRFLLIYEREIHDWLWASVEGGVRSNLQFDLKDSASRNADIVIENEINTAMIINFSLFIVAPKRFLEL